ncbi:DUF72 domain-containing protein, partial [Candidatus Bathyarchaeota archaeon]|nr:DUF72 domain-containing protein [Candidatus Bathyarchaeota archaeon]
MSTVKLHVGCSGWSYRDWLGAFYPRRMDPSKFLQYYARVFECVEIDSTFYKIPSKRIVSKWHDSTPESFGFVAKMFKG